jgi:hypothetical protein
MFSLLIFNFTQNGKNIHNFSNLYTGWMNHESKLIHDSNYQSLAFITMEVLFIKSIILNHTVLIFFSCNRYSYFGNQNGTRK